MPTGVAEEGSTGDGDETIAGEPGPSFDSIDDEDDAAGLLTFLPSSLLTAFLICAPIPTAEKRHEPSDGISMIRNESRILDIYDSSCAASS